MQKKYSYTYYKRKTKKYKANSVTILIIVALFLIIIMATLFFSMQKTKNNGNTIYYAIETGSFADINSSLVAIQSDERKGGAGFLIKDGDYRVITACYKTEKEALSVIENLKKMVKNVKLYKIIIPNINLKSTDGEINHLIGDSINSLKNSIDDLFALSISVDSKEITEYSATQSLNGVKEKNEHFTENIERLSLQNDKKLKPVYNELKYLLKKYEEDEDNLNMRTINVRIRKINLEQILCLQKMAKEINIYI